MSSKYPKPKHGMKLSVDGFDEINKSLQDLSLTQAKGVVRRSLMVAAEPVADRARDLAPIDMKRDDGKHLYESISASTKLTPTQRRKHRKERNSVEAFVGVTEEAPHGHLQEFGTEHHAAQPFMRPAWDGKKMQVLDRLKTELWKNIARRVRLNAKKAARDAAKGKL
jgi:HK97 gp10 family phage protein